MGKFRTTFMRSLKVAAVVTLLALVGADIGLRTTIVLFCSDNLSRYVWCGPVTTEYEKLSEWIFGNLANAKLTDLLVVVFTYFLVRVGRGQQRVMVTQAMIADRQTEILNKQLLAQGPLLLYDVYKLEIKTDNPERTILKDYKVSLQWRNSGKDVATNVTYWIGPVLEPAVGDDAARRRETEEKFEDTIFRATALSGHVAVAPNGTVETDQIVLLPCQLRALHQKQIRFFVWCVMGYRSRLQSEGWFEEIAIYLEFVLDQDPDIYELTVKGINRGPFRVRIAGYRYRTVDGRPPA